MPIATSTVIRAGLGRVGARLAAGQPVTIAWFGGSITEAGGADGGYRGYTTAALRKRYPDSDITEINAGIGGTGSDLGAFRMAQDVLAHDPHLVVVEFAVNDGKMDPSSIVRAMEGIVRQALAHATQPDVCLVYTLAERDLESHGRGELPDSMQAHERVAEYYGLPSVNMALPVAQAVLDGSLVWADAFGDSCHPTAGGHQRYADILTAALDELFTMEPGAMDVLPAPIDVRHLGAARLQPLRASDAAAGWTYVPMENRGGWHCFDGMLEATTPGSEISVDFSGPTLGLFYHISPDCGDIEWAVDDQPMQHARLFDEYAHRFGRPSYRVLTDELGPGPHRVRMAVSEQRAPLSTGHAVRLAHLMVFDESR